MSSIIPAALGQPSQPMAFFSGPSFAKELVEDVPTVVVVASKDQAVREQVQALFHHPVLRVYTSSDVVGVEVGGALKNVFAIGTVGLL
jgi:glycerol-3-phosphate dehydrogenase